MSSALIPPRPRVVYPETDGLPMAENTVQFRWIVLIKTNLDVIFAKRDDVFVAGDHFWYPVEGNPGIRAAPDVMVVFGRPKGDRRCYLQWEEGGIAPQVVWEILSPGNRHGEMLAKFQFYDDYGVEEYYLYDPDSAEISGWLRRDGRLQPIPTMDGWVSPRLGVRFTKADDELELLRPDGKPFQSFDELAQLAEQAEKQVERAEEHAERAAKHAEAAQMQAALAQQQVAMQARLIEQLQEKLRSQGIEPNA